LSGLLQNLIALVPLTLIGISTGELQVRKQTDLRV